MRKFSIILSASLVLVCCFSCKRHEPEHFTIEEGRGKQLESFIENLQGRDSILIADQLRYGASLQGIPGGSIIALPGEVSAQGIETIRGWELDTVELFRRDSTTDIKAYTTLAVFEEGEYLLPGFEIAVIDKEGGIDTLSFDGQDILVCTMPVDTASFVVHDIKAQRTIPVQLREWLPWSLGGAAFLAAVVFGVIFIIRMMNRKKGRFVQDPPYIVALRKLDGFRGTQNWAADKQKGFYSGVTDTLREYISKRYGIGAMEMTTAEIMAALRKEDVPEDLKAELKGLLEDADSVKFAKAVFDDEHNAGVLPTGVKFVMTTYQQELDAEEKKEDKENGI